MFSAPYPPVAFTFNPSAPMPQALCSKLKRSQYHHAMAEIGRRERRPPRGLGRSLHVV